MKKREKLSSTTIEQKSTNYQSENIGVASPLMYSQGG